MARVIHNTTSSSLHVYYGKKFFWYFKHKKDHPHISKQLIYVLMLNLKNHLLQKHGTRRPLLLLPCTKKYKSSLNSAISKHNRNTCHNDHQTFFLLYPNNPFIVHQVMKKFSKTGYIIELLQKGQKQFADLQCNALMCTSLIHFVV